MRNTRKKIISVVLMFLCACVIQAQPKQKEINGSITDIKGEPLIGVSISIKNQPGLGTITDIDGKYTIKTGAYDVLEAKYLGYKTTDIPVAKGEFNVVLQEDIQSLGEVVVMGAGNVALRKITLSGAITTVDVDRIKIPTGNLSNALVGNVVGIIGHQSSGEPGEDITEFWVRGIGTFGANDKALVLVDGIERPLDQLNVEDIESFSVLKDASATAIYGSRGANGVILITTKHGVAGKVNINFKAEYGYNTRSRTPEYTDGYTYATMANEARLTRYQNPAYSDQDIQIIQKGLDPDLFPNIDWQDVILRDGANDYRATISFSGGGNTSRYYVSGSYYNTEGMYKTLDINKYGTNVSYERYNYRSNVDMDLTQSTLLRLGVSGFLVNQTKPRAKSDEIWESLSNLTPLTVPRQYSNGLIPAYGSSYSSISPEVLLNRVGYVTRWENKAETNVTLEQGLDLLAPGLRFIGTFSFDSENSSEIVRTKTPDLWYADQNRDADGNLVLYRKVESSLMNQVGTANGQKRYYTEAKLDYNHLFGESHRISGLLMYFMQERSYTMNITSDVRSSIPFRNMALSGRGTYGFKDRYLAEFNFGYNGSENFEPGERFGFFPAVSGAWVISEEPFVKNNLSWLDMFKVRYSYGLTGNDKIMKNDQDWAGRFPYMSFITTSSSYNWGEYGSNNVQGYRITTMGSPGLTWETSEMQNLGIDFVFLNNKITLTTDFFKEHRSDIFMLRSLMPFSTGLQDLRPYANIGEMEREGMEGIASYSDKIGNLSFTFRGNFTLAKTNVLNYDEADNALAYQMTKGYRLNQTRGLIALGLFENQDDINNSPKQTFGDVLPGDIKYKDVNGDGLVDGKDEVPMGFTSVPNLVYGAGLSLAWKKFDFNILVQGSSKSDFFIGGSSIYPFINEKSGNILVQMANPKDRWISREISGDPATENPNAILPRLSYGSTTSGTSNNYRNSTFWLRDGSYLRVKNVEFGYSFPKRYAQAVFAENIRLGFIGYNLLVFSPFKWWDPELGNRDGTNYKDGAKYPISKNYTFNLTVNF